MYIDGDFRMYLALDGDFKMYLALGMVFMLEPFW
jgi:hypothetical protein